MLFPVLILLHIVGCYSSVILFRDVRDLTDLEKQKADSPFKSLVFLRRNSTLNNPFTLTSNLTTVNANKPAWKVVQVTDNQHDKNIILLSKPKTFVDEKNNSPKHKQTSSSIANENSDFIREIPISLSSRIYQHSSTPSSIEFYYSYETEEQPNPSYLKANCHSNNTKTANVDFISSINSSFLVFHISGPLHNQSIEKKSSVNPSPPSNDNLDYIDFSSKSIEKPANRLQQILQDNNKYTTATKSMNTQNSGERKLETNIWKTISQVVTKYHIESTTQYDKIKFFEMYDKETPVPLSIKTNMFDHSQNVYEQFQLENKIVERIELKHVDQSSHEHNITKYSKKHIVNFDKISTRSSLNTFKPIKMQNNSSHSSLKRKFSTTSYVTNRSPEKSKPIEYKKYSHKNNTVLWSEYPFAAVYIYEPSKVHCDAAGISAHWLVSSGSCLSRINNHRSPVLGDGRSAFVAYCGDSWWQPERIAYVKHSLVHPSYHPRNQTRKLLYNIGVIQVSSSMMSACTGWAPVSLMSHQFAANPGGSKALALGWGLDRYDTSYSATDLPKTTLMIYKGLVFSDSCPGNIAYRLSMEKGVVLKYVYCLSLPPYSGERQDPVHGSLLFVGGKLIALYLQEERRRRGEQSAQYTGIWRLIPWVTEVAKEPDEMEGLFGEI